MKCKKGTLNVTDLKGNVLDWIRTRFTDEETWVEERLGTVKSVEGVELLEWAYVG